MIEKIFILQDADPMVFYGVNNANLRMLRALFSKLRIVGRGSVLKIIGNPEDIAEFDVVYEAIYRHCVNYNKLTEEDIVTLIQGRSNEQLDKEGVIVYSTSGKPILARSQNQQKLVDVYKKDDLLFCIGPAGTGKTYTAIALAVRALKNKEVKKIILSRPAVEAGEKLGFLPGDMREKVDPYLQPLYDALQEMLPAAKLQEYLDTSVIQIAPLAFMRGRTLNDAVVILDEAQNTTRAQLKMFLTRMGMNTKMIVTGDITQIDLPRMQQSGLIEAIRILRHIQGISFVEMDKSDIVRHKLVARIVKAYEQTAHTKDDASTTEEQQRISEECYSNN
ncbi:PhoH family protein [Alloprevotella tannerae]|uniref:PhoH family protein n=1 Tax=Alloprevotella tannerae TaxID=76122 RepID=UPI003C6F8530